MLTPKQDETFNNLASALYQLSKGNDGVVGYLTREEMMRLADGAYGALMDLWGELPKEGDCVSLSTITVGAPHAADA